MNRVVPNGTLRGVEGEGQISPIRYSAMSKVAAVSGATGSDLEALRDKAREMGEKTKW